MDFHSKEQLSQFVKQTVKETPVTDIHTHLFSEAFGEHLLWGVDELLTYHYLIAETLRHKQELPYETFWAMSKREQADLVWQTLFIENSPYSESCRGVVTVLNRLGLDLGKRDLNEYRAHFEKMTAGEQIDRIFELAKVTSACMTNDPFDGAERKLWENGGNTDPRFLTALRIDPLLNDWSGAWQKLRGMGYDVSSTPHDQKTIQETKRFLGDWVQKINPLYMAVSLPSDFQYPQPGARETMIDKCVLPVCREAGIPFAMMIGVKRQVNPSLRLAGDGLGKADIGAVERIVSRNQENKFLITMLSRENQHELAVTARKNRNLLVFGCWWFLNNPSLIEEMTRMRLELLGTSVVPQHSDCRVLEQLLYKWNHSREILGKVLSDKYGDLYDAGWELKEEEIRRDVESLLGEAFWTFIGKKNPFKR